MNTEPWDDSTYEIQQRDLHRILAIHEDDTVPSRPPETEFYNDVENATLWRDISRLYEDFMGPDEEKWLARQEQFLTVIIDIRVRLRDSPREHERRV